MVLSLPETLLTYNLEAFQTCLMVSGLHTPATSRDEVGIPSPGELAPREGRYIKPIKSYSNLGCLCTQRTPDLLEVGRECTQEYQHCSKTTTQNCMQLLDYCHTRNLCCLFSAVGF